MIFLLFAAAYAEGEDEEGYDENTELTIKGTVKEVITGIRGPVIILLKSGKKEYRVVTAPPWYIAGKGIEFKTGTSYEIIGSKYISAEGRLYIVANRLRDLSSGAIISLRDSSCMPLWRGRRMMRGGRSGY